VTHCRSQEKI